MAFTIKTADTIRSDILRDISNQLPDADTGSDSDFVIRATGTGSAIEGLYEHQLYIYRQIFADTADTDNLQRHAATRGLSKKRATAAGGSIVINGQPGAPVTGAIVAQTLDARQYTTTATGVIGADGTLTLAATCTAVGSAGNADAGTTLTLLAPPNGVTSAASIVKMVGGTDDETDAELLARLLDVIRRPPAGGNQWDFRRWAMNVDGVSAAYVYPLRRGLGTCDVVITASGGLPSAATITAVQAAIDGQRPVTAKNCLVLAPTIVTIDHVVQVAFPGGTAAGAQAAIEPGIAAYFTTLEPGAQYIKSRIEGIITDTAGITDRTVVMPTGNFTPEVDATVVQWCQMGNLTVSLMQ
ncbi:baseplate J/gp47 family protein [Burkholderia vietnamiensis]|uniref:baseplate J/gp47 family protein n=1 Tax=Burkholderia vietnamiensis TaxID=60552 RepID=UPI000841CCA3|nr:baseplate J/gp47 family protein [Burkholderia vietnamiensis]AOJ13144.1 phage tail protein [Burkholderia vietnamiensis]HDR9256419.1 baseplate J/gp47 family protein [Burkholderia vietnamiensis]